MHRSCSVVGALSCALLGWTGAAAAQEPLRAVVCEESGQTQEADARTVVWRLRFVRLQGLPDTTRQARLNTYLGEMVHRRLDAFRDVVRSLAAPGSESRLQIVVSVGVLTSRLLSIELRLRQRMGGMSEDGHDVAAFTFDLGTGRPVAFQDMVVPADAQTLADRVDLALRADPANWSAGQPYRGQYRLSRVRAEDLRAVLVHEDGLEFLWGSYEPPAHDRRPTAIKLPFARLRDLLHGQVGQLAVSRPEGSPSAGGMGVTGALGELGR